MGKGVKSRQDNAVFDEMINQENFMDENEGKDERIIQYLEQLPLVFAEAGQKTYTQSPRNNSKQLHHSAQHERRKRSNDRDERRSANSHSSHQSANFFNRASSNNSSGKNIRGVLQDVFSGHSKDIFQRSPYTSQEERKMIIEEKPRGRSGRPSYRSAH